MKIAPTPANEVARLRGLRSANVLDTPPSPGFDDIAKIAAFICGTPIALVSLVDEHRQWFKARIGLDTTETPRDVAFCAHAILGRDTFVVNDARQDPRFFDNPLVTSGPQVRFYAGAPLVDEHDRAFGTLCVLDREPRDLNHAQKEALSALARQVMSQIALVEHGAGMRRLQEAAVESNARLEATIERLEHRDATLRHLNDMGEMLQSCRTNQELDATLTDFASRLFPAQSGTVCTLSGNREDAIPFASWGSPVHRLDPFPSEECWAVRRGRTHRSQVARGIRCGHASQGTAEVCVPMLAEGSVRGSVHMTFADDTEAAEHVQLVETMAERFGLAMANFRLRESLRTQSVTDPLTGLFNRRHLDDVTTRELRRCARHDLPFTMLLIDVDHFKNVNDTFGHDAGDEVLRQIAKFVRKSVRTEDMVYRYGGEEFVVGFAEGALDGCLARAETLRRGVKELAISHNNRPIGPISISVGASQAPHDGMTTSALLSAADRALYRAKALGRDRIVAATRLPVLRLSELPRELAANNTTDQ